MIILGIDTSAVAASAALLKDGKIISEAYVNIGLTHSQTLMELVDSCLKNAFLTFSDVNAVAVNCGPGSFTGIRIGVSAVKGLCFANNVGAYAVSTLEAMAYSAFTEDIIICPVMDARCNQVYTALFEKKDGELKRICEDAPLLLTELEEKLCVYTKKIVFVGDGTNLCTAYFANKPLKTEAITEIFKYQRACGVAFAAWVRYNNGEQTMCSAELQPQYLRLSQAEREKNKGDKKI